jgi:hypothetical protein
MRVPVGDGDIAVTYDAIDTQAQNHQQLATFYQQTAASVKAKADAVVETLQQWNPQQAAAYNQWSAAIIQSLLKEAQAHQNMADYLTKAKAAYNTTESTNTKLVSVN